MVLTLVQAALCREGRDRPNRKSIGGMYTGISMWYTQGYNETHQAFLSLFLFALLSLSASHMIQHFVIQHTFCQSVCVCTCTLLPTCWGGLAGAEASRLWGLGIFKDSWIRSTGLYKPKPTNLLWHHIICCWGGKFPYTGASSWSPLFTLWCLCLQFVFCSSTENES